MLSKPTNIESLLFILILEQIILTVFVSLVGKGQVSIPKTILSMIGGAIGGMVGGATWGAIFGVLFGWIIGGYEGIIYMMILGAIVGLFLGPITEVYEILKKYKIDNGNKIQDETAKMVIIILMVAGAIVGAIGPILVGMVGIGTVGIISGIIVGAFFGWLFGWIELSLKGQSKTV